MANNTTPRRNNVQYTRRKPQKRKNNDAPLHIIMIVLAVAVCLSIVFLVNYLKEDAPVDNLPKETDFKQTTGEKESEESTENQTEEQTTAKPVETTPPEPVYVPEFKSDLSAYEMYMNPQGDQRDAYLILVNYANPLSEDYVPPNLISVQSTRKDGRATQKLQEYAAKALEALMIEAEACGMVTKNTPSGYPLSVMSAYRTYAYQSQLFNGYINTEMKNKGLSRADAEKLVATYSARPGTSEHQTGLCVDMHTLSSAGQAFKNEKEAKWLAENCYKFGFILRFAEDKMDKTGGIIYEPWHFRYVGRYHAKKMYDMNLCLEEYVEYLKNN
ncbi:MAG: M15 family metallopeptidase [Clostridia bacterium]|nr:M15 family metallopeptidase [Clostridia bacterium]